MQQPMRDPAAGVPRELLPHLHLVSKYRYPTLNHITIDTVVGHLTEAPKIVHDLQPVVWQFIEAPADGTVLLVWQPLDYVGTNFASDGYVWGDAEHAFTSEHNGYVVEMWLHRGGYQWPNEPYTAHSRKRYRITQSKNPSAPPSDPSLWIIHYTRADREHILPSNQLQVQAPVQASLQQRRFLQNQGSLARKEFMLHDKANWPTIHLPSSQGGGQGVPYAPHVMARQQAAAAQMQVGASPARNAPDRGQHRRGPSNALEPTLEEEEDVSRGDLLDFMTPRDISKMRYEQHHEWMEEIMSSPFAMKQIVPTDLGLGRKGELEALTGGFFDPPTSVLQETSANASAVRVGRMEVGKAEEFTARAARKVAEMEVELENLKKRHARRMAKLDKSSSLMTAEKRLRTAATEDRRPGGMFGHGEGGRSSRVDEIVGEVQGAMGKKMVAVSAVECVQEGGLEVKVSSPRDTAAGPNGFPEAAMPKGQPTTSTPDMLGASPEAGSAQRRRSPPPLQVQTQAASESPANAPLPAQPAGASHGHEMSPAVAKDGEGATAALPSLDDMDVDVEMAGLVHEAAVAEGPMIDADGSEWVMVDDMATPDQASEMPAAGGAAPREPEPSTTEAAKVATPPVIITNNTTTTQTSTSDGTRMDFSPGPAAEVGPADGTALIPGLSLTKAEEADTESSWPKPPAPASPASPASPRLPPSTLAPTQGPGISTSGAEFDGGPGDLDSHLADAGGAGLIDFGDDDQTDLHLEGMDDSAFGQAFHPPEDE